MEVVDKELYIASLGVVQILSRDNVVSAGLVKERLMSRIAESRGGVEAVCVRYCRGVGRVAHLKNSNVPFAGLRVDLVLSCGDQRKNRRAFGSQQTQGVPFNTLLCGSPPIYCTCAFIATILGMLTCIPMADHQQNQLLLRREVIFRSLRRLWSSWPSSGVLRRLWSS